MHFNVAVRVPAHVPLKRARVLAHAAMKSRHLAHCRTEPLWDGFGPPSDYRYAPVGFLVVAEDRPTNQRDPRWWEHRDEYVALFEDAASDALWARWGAEHPDDHVFIYDVHA